MTRKRQKAYLSLRDRLILNFVFFGVVIILIIGAFSYYTARDVLLDRTFEQLTSVRVVKKRQIESFFADRARDVKLIVASQETQDLLKTAEINSIPEINEINIVSENYLLRYLAAQQYYTSIYLIRDGSTIRIPIIEEIEQAEYISDASELGIINRISEEISPQKGLAFYDLALNDISNGIFISAPIMISDKVVGIVALEISIDAINKIMLETNPYEGLGESGESYLVGDDMLMRSKSRFQNNSVLTTRVATYGVEMAFAGKDSIALIDDYRGIKVLSSFSRVEIDDLNWVILAEIDLSEALVPLNAIRNNIVLISSFIIMLLFFAAVFLSSRITSPIIRLKKAAEKIGQGDFSTELESGLKNEIGDLTNSFNTMTLKLAEKTSELKKERLKRLRSVIDGQELERQRLSRELHDGLGQMLIALKLKLENVRSTDQCDTLEMMKDVKSSFDGTIEEVRRMSNDLMPSVLYEFGITTALRNLVDQVSDDSGIVGLFKSSGKFEDLDKTAKTYLYRIAQEAVNNAVKHADASSIKVEIIRTEDAIRMTIEDDGKGFDVEGASSLSGNGLHNIRERIGLLHGSLDIGPGENKGILIKMIIPYKKVKR